MVFFVSKTLDLNGIIIISFCYCTQSYLRVPSSMLNRGFIVNAGVEVHGDVNTAMVFGSDRLHPFR